MEYSGKDMDNSGILIERVMGWINRAPAVPLYFAESDYGGGLHTFPLPLVELVFVVRGGVRMRVGRHSARLATGECAVINAHFGNEGQIEGRADFRYACVSFDIARERTLRDLGRTPLLAIRTLENPGTIHHLYREVAQAFHSPTSPLKGILVKAAVLRLLAALCSCGTGPAVTSSDSGDCRLRRALTLMFERQADPALSVIDLARAATLSPDQLGRLFRREFGMSTLQYLLQVRLNRASNLLKHGERSVKEVAFMTGFADPLYFSRIFRKTFGHPPTASRGHV